MWKAVLSLFVVMLLGTATEAYGIPIVILYGKKGICRPDGTVICERPSRTPCAIIIRNVYPSNPQFPDDLQLYDDEQLTFQSPCHLLGTNADGTEAYVDLP
ncbi:MAG: hypothetical protein RML15_05095 [Bacteroidota bacterium]|nr:hypothetical protein [Candidatus Kapabacteria bacterium]MCS7302512.1 hypothetical protein [Candidatus Kapabacteria bacterium]MCX7937290.1 hypothetical protein [Chlorobiota bacterium]MDW8075552.1 hypothetical protein [Bacteroidota bacterium]MDW8271769.1 hypothetical protein [Bacteroidota bacterium]